MTTVKTTTAFAALCELEPRLRQIEADVRRYAVNFGPRMAEEVWYGRAGFKARMSTLVGFGRRDDGDPHLRSPEAYDTAYWHLFGILSAIRRSRHAN
jgi:hypothetical protein